MNSIVKWIVIAAILMASISCTPKPSMRNQAEINSPETVAKNQVAVELKVIGVGYDSGLAQSDSTSTYYAVRRGVQYQYAAGNVKLRLNNTGDEATVPVENLSKAKTVRLDNGFFIYEYPYNGSLFLPRPYKKTVVAVNITKPFSYLSRMFVKCLNEEYNGIQGNHNGYLFLTGLSYQSLMDQSLKVQAEILIMEDPEVRFK